MRRVAVDAGADELYAAVVRGERVDQLAFMARMVRSLRPVLNDQRETEISNESGAARRSVQK